MNLQHLPLSPGPDTTWTSITRAHGGGGLLTDSLISHCILPRLGNDILDDLLDSAELDVDRSRLAFTLDSYVVEPLFFPGGDIGRLAVSGTVNDLSVMGAKPLALALGMILCEGLSRPTLERILDSLAACATQANVRVVTGDTKVIGHSATESLYLITAGVGLLREGLRLSPRKVREGDVILLNGPIADHGVAVMLAREMPQVRSVVRSDVTPLNSLIASLLDRVGDTGAVRFMRDATRGGLAGVCADLAERTGLHVELDETSISVRPETLHAAEMLGLDPLDVANEGKVVCVVAPEATDAALDALRSHPAGTDARAIGVITAERDGLCELKTAIGGRRVVFKPYGEQLPRIC